MGNQYVIDGDSLARLANVTRNKYGMSNEEKLTPLGAITLMSMLKTGTETSEFIGLVDGSGLVSVTSENITNIRRNAFTACADLEDVRFTNVTSVGYQSFAVCQKLKKADFGNAQIIYGQAFLSCTALEALIIRAPKMCVFDEPVLGGGAGNNAPDKKTYIYVPSSLISAYKTAEVSSKYAAQFRAIEDYPEICGA